MSERPERITCVVCGCTDARLAPPEAWTTVWKIGAMDVRAAIPHYDCPLCKEWTVADADIRAAAKVLGVDPGALVPTTLN